MEEKRSEKSTTGRCEEGTQQKQNEVTGRAERGENVLM